MNRNPRDYIEMGVSSPINKGRYECLPFEVFASKAAIQHRNGEGMRLYVIFVLLSFSSSAKAVLLYDLIRSPAFQMVGLFSVEPITIFKLFENMA